MNQFVPVNKKRVSEKGLTNTRGKGHVMKKKQSIEENMKSKGYSFSSNPDLIINISTKSREDIYINQTYNRFNYGWYGFPYDQNYRPYTRTTGLLYIDIIDSKNGSLIWNASGSGSLYSGRLSRDELISNFVNKVLESYPSQS